nr:hypothetical protein [Tanacetum cinerariifolium]
MDSQRVDLLMEDRTAHQETILIVEEEAYAVREAWAHSIGLRTKGVVGLTRWIEKMESVFQISGCAIENQVKFATYSLLDAALTWWNSQIRSLGPDAYSMTWEVLKKKITDKYCLQGEIKKLEIELWNLKASKPKTLDETMELANDLMDQKLRTYAERQTNNKRKADDLSRNNHGHPQQPAKRQNVAKVYNMGSGERKPYGGNLPKCTKCHLHHNVPCTQKCHKCNKIGHFARDCRSSGNASVVNAQRNNEENPKGNGCFECGAPGHFKRDCPKLRNKDEGDEYEDDETEDGPVDYPMDGGDDGDDDDDDSSGDDVDDKDEEEEEEEHLAPADSAIVIPTVGESSPNPTTSNPKRRNPRRSKQHFILEESPVDMMADQRTMAKLLSAPTEGYGEAIVVPSILAMHFELKHSLINMITSDQAAHRWLKKEPPCSILTWEDLVSKFINEFFPPSRTTNLHNEISNFQQQFDESFHEAWDRYKDLLRACPPKLTHAVNQQTSAVTTAMTGLRRLSSNTIANPKGELKAITTRSGIVLDGPSVPMPHIFINLKKDERVEETLTDLELGEFTINFLPHLVQKPKPPSQRNYLVHQRDPLHPNIPYPSTLLSNKEKLLKLANTPFNENCLVVILKKLPEKLGDPRKFLISCGFSELKCKALADLGASINLMPLPVWKKLGLPKLISTCMTLKLANQAICTPAKIARDTARALIDVHGEKMILRDGDERLTLNMRHDTSSYSNQPQKESINMINTFDDSCEDYLKDLFAANHLSGNPTCSSHIDLTSPEVKDDIFDLEGDIVLIEKLINLDSTKDLPLTHNINPLSSNTNYSSSDHLLEELTNELGLIIFPPRNDDLSNLTNPNVNLLDTILEMFTDEHALDYSPLLLYDEYEDDDLFKLEPDKEYAYDDPFNSKGEKIKESKLLIDELDLPRSSDFLPSPDNVQTTPDNNVEKIAISNASLILEDFYPPLYEIPFHQEVPWFETLLSFSFKNEENFFIPGILTSKGVHSSLLLELSHRGPKVFKLIKIVESSVDIFPCFYGEDIRILDVLRLYFYG